MNTNLLGFLVTGYSVALFIVFYIVLAIADWKIFTKAGEAGWKAIVPIVNLYVLYKITWGHGLLFLLLLIPFVSIVVEIITCYKLARCFGHGIGFTLGLIFFPYIFTLILGFGSSEYSPI